MEPISSLKLRALTAMLVCAAILAGLGRARADPPVRNYVGNFLGYNAEPSNFASLQGHESSGNTSASFYLEKVVSPFSSISLFGGAERYTGEFGTTGFGNLELSYKQVLFEVRDVEFLFSAAPSLEIPTGDPNVGETHPRAGVDLLYEKGFGGLPEPLAPLRAFALEGDFYWDSKITGARNDLFFTNAELEYSIEYLDDNILHARSNDFVHHLTPHIDFEYAQYFSDHRNSSAPDFELTPALAWLNRTFEVNLGIQIGMNRSSSSTGSVGFVWLVGVSFDQLWPALAWTPFR